MLFFYCWNLTFTSYRSLISFWTLHSVSALFLSWVTSSSFSFWLMTLVRPEALRTEGRLKKTSFSMPYMPCHKQKRSHTGLSPQICVWFMLQETSSEQSSKPIVLQHAEKNFSHDVYKKINSTELFQTKCLAIPNSWWQKPHLQTSLSLLVL